jgi:hypothetical protein
VERAAEALGAEIAADERTCVERMGEVAPTMYLGMGGTGVPMRKSEVVGRGGKQADGSAKTREAKVVTMWTAEARDEENRPVRDPGSITYSAGIESAAALDTSPDRSEFADRVLREATRRGFTEASHCVVLGDGSAWIWNTTKELFPRAIQILDRFHAKEHLSAVGKVIYGDSEPGQKWIQRRYDELDEDSPVHARPFEPGADRYFATGFDNAGRGAQTLRVKFRVAQAVSIIPDVFSALRRSGVVSRLAMQGLQEWFQAGTRRQRYHRPALLQAQRTLRGFLGAPFRKGGRRVIPKSDVHPRRHVVQEGTERPQP